MHLIHRNAVSSLRSSSAPKATSCRVVRSAPHLQRPHLPSPLGLKTSSFTLRGKFQCRAAAEDPYQVLGIAPDADNNEINRAYNKRRFENKADPGMLARLEDAHSRLMMAAFNARLKAGSTVPREIKFADREQLFPWKPKRWDATPRIILIVGAVQLVLMSMAYQAPNISKAVGCMLVGVVGNVMKQNAIFPPPRDPDMATEEEAGRPGRNFVRGVLLGLGATCGGIVLFSFPEYMQQLFNVTLPISQGLQVSLKVFGAAVCNWVMTAYFY